MKPDRIRLPFAEQIEFLRGKLNLPTERWTDIERGAHDRAFVVAGAMQADLLDDLRGAVDKAVSGGSTLADFRRDFVQIVEKRGWADFTGDDRATQGRTGGRGLAWRTRTIYQTNIAASYAAGRWQQLNDPDLLAARPYWRYVHSDFVANPRPQHQAWGNSGLTLRHDHPFWKTHFPPNGWGCRCTVRAVAAPAGDDATAPPAGWDTRDARGRLPGVDTGWDYAPGAGVQDELARRFDDKLDKLPAPVAEAARGEMLRYMHPSKFFRPTGGDARARDAALKDFLGPAMYRDIRAGLEGTPALGLTNADRVAIRAYTMDFWYKELNAAVKEKSLASGLRRMRNHAPLIEALDAALEKLPKYKGEINRGFRTRDLSRYHALANGDVITLTGYQSGNVDQPGLQGDVRMRIRARTARRVQAISAYGVTENEAIIPRNRQYRVVSVEKTPESVMLILEELPQGAEVHTSRAYLAAE